MGKDIRTSIVFEAAKVTIAETGETIGREHQTRLNKAVKAKPGRARSEERRRAPEEPRQTRSRDRILEGRVEGRDRADRSCKLVEDIELHKQKIDAEREELKELWHADPS